MSEKRKIAKAAGKMSVATFISRVLGYIRDMIIAFYLGAGGLSDTFFISFRIPNLLRELFAEGTMASSVIPVLTEYQQKDEREAVTLVRVAFAFILTVVGAICVLGIIFAPQVVFLIAPGFADDSEKFRITVLLTRIMFPFLLFVSLSALLMGTLNTKRIFFLPALAPAILNVVIITSTVVLAVRVVEPVIAMAIGVALGGFVQFVFQLPKFRSLGYSIRPLFRFRHRGLIKILKLVVPITFGTAVAQINIVVSSILGSFLAAGSITYLFYSMRLIQFPIGVFGVAMGMAILPSLSMHALNKQMDLLRDDFSFALRFIFFISVPAMAGLIALREPIINLLFQRGQFDYIATKGTADAMLFYSLGIWAVVGVRVLTSTFYSMQDTRTPVKAAVSALLTNIVLSLLLMGPMAHSGLALANAMSGILNFTLLIYWLKKRLGRIDGRRILASFINILVASTVMAVVAGLLLRGELWRTPGGELLKASYLAGTIALSVAIYIMISRIMKSEELAFMLTLIKDKIKNREEPS